MNGTGSPTSAIFDMEMERLDQEIEKTRKQFYTALLGKKRRVKRKWLEISAMTNAHLLQTLPYRAMLGHVAKLAEERDKFIAQTETENSLRDNNEKCEHEKVDEESPIENAVKSQTLLSEEKSDPRLARDESIQTEESSFSNES